MGLLNDKKDVFTTIGAYTSLNNQGKLPDGTNTIDSINNNSNASSFLVDVLKVVVGSGALKQLVGELIGKFVNTVEPNAKSSVKNQTIQYNSGDPLPTYFRNGIQVPVSKIDVYGKYKVNQNSKSGSLLYTKNKPSFDNSAYNAISNPNTDITYNNLLINYNPTSNNFTFKASSNSTTVGSWFSNYIDNTTFIDKKEFISNVMNSVYGTINNAQGKTIEEISEELKTEKLLEQLRDGNDSFELSQDDLDDILNKSSELSNGVVKYNMGCGEIEANLNIDDLTTLIQNISGSTNPFQIGNDIENTVNQSTSNVDPEVINQNKESIKDDFFTNIIKKIIQILIQLVTTSPQIRMLLAISSAIQNNGVVNLNKPSEDLKNFKTFIKCMSNEITRLINEFIFNLIIGFLIALLKPVISKIIQEKINQYISILKSLISSNI